MDNKDTTWSEAIEKIMINHGYFATLKQLYEETPKLKTFIGKTPDRTINERVQRDKRFTKIMPGLWALTEYLDKLPEHLNPRIKKSEQEKVAVSHSLMQGYLIEIGNIKGYSTFTLDKNGLFLNKRLADIISFQSCPKFTYKKVIRRVQYIDVIWFNQRGYPSNVIEVEHSTNFRNAFLKFLELQDFVTKMIIVAPQERREQFDREIMSTPFEMINKKIKFTSYDDVEKIYSTSMALKSLKNVL